MALAYVGARVYGLAPQGAWDDVYVSAALADVLRHGEVSGAPLAVSVASANDARAKHVSLLAAGVVSWAQIAPPDMEDSFEMERGGLAVFVPLTPTWRTITMEETAAVRAVVPVPLTAAYLAVAPDALESIGKDQDALRRTLHGRILRTGETMHADFAMRSVLTEPVLQGVVDCATTELYLVQDTAGSKETTEVQADPVLDETFLERALARSTVTDDRDGLATHASTLTASAALQPEWVDEAVARWHRTSGSEVYVDPESVVLVSDTTLAELAAFNGDWALAEVRGADRPRMVRLLAAPPHRASATYVPPTLAMNLAGDASLDSDIALTLHPLPTNVADELDTLRHGDAAMQALAGAAAQPPLMPRAEALSVARIASPIATDRAFDAQCLDALRRHLEHRPRILKKGDVFAVPVATSRARFEQADAEQDAPSESAREIARTAQLPGPLAPTYARTAVYFCVTELEADLEDPEAVAARIPESAPALERWYATLAASRRMDGAGCWADATHTRIVQTGLEQRRIANVGAWLGLTSDTYPYPGKDTPLTAEGSIFSRYVQLVRAALSPSAQRLGVHLAILLEGAAGSGKRMLTRWVAECAGVHLLELNCFELVSDTDAHTEGILRAKFERARTCAPCIILLQNVDTLAKKGQNEGQTTAVVKLLQRCMEPDEESGPIFFVGTTEDAERCPPVLLACFNQTLKLDPPAEPERRQLLDLALQRYAVAADVDTKLLAVQTAALLPADLGEVVERARLASATRLATALELNENVWTMADIAAARPVLVQSDLDKALGHVRASYSESIGAPKIPNVTWDDVGGLASVKNEILDTVQLPLEHPELFSDGVKKRSGVLLYGPPGTGKTLLAKAVATTCSLNFFSVKGPELLNMYIGESEANVRRVFQRARDAKPCVIFFDELDSVAPKRGNQGDSGGVMDRIVSQLLAELDGMASGSAASDVFVIGATNRPDLLDPALLRPGRFDRMLYLSVAETHDAQRNILQALTRKFTLDEDVGDMTVIAEQCPFNLTGADFYALCSDAMLKAMTEKAEEIDAKVAERNKEPRTGDRVHWPVPLTPQFYLAELAEPSEVQVRVHRRHFEQALAELSPSVSEQEMAHYREVQKQFSQPEDKKESDTTTAEPKGKANEPLGQGKGKAPAKGKGKATEPEGQRAALPQGPPGTDSLPAAGAAAAAGATADTTAEPAGSAAAPPQEVPRPGQGKGKGKARAP